MPDERESLMTGPVQPELICSDQMRADLFAAEEAGAEGRNPDFTAARFYAARPEAYREIVSLRAELVPIATIARMFKVSRNTVAAIDRRELHRSPVEHLKHSAALSYRHLARIGAEMLREILLDPDSLETFRKSPDKLSVMIAVLEDKAELLTGGATQRVEVVDGPRGSAAQELLALAREHAAMMGIRAEFIGQKGAACGREGQAGDGGTDVSSGVDDA